MGNAELGLEAAVKFYLNGFEKIHHGIDNIIGGTRSEDGGAFLSKESVKSMLIQTAYTLVFWTLTAWILGVWTVAMLIPETTPAVADPLQTLPTESPPESTTPDDVPNGGGPD